MAESRPPVLELDPPLLNSANPWATTLEDLRALYACPSTGAVTTRTTLIQGFSHDPVRHQYIFFNTESHTIARDGGHASGPGNASLNSLGYSPIPLDGYLGFIRTIVSEQSSASMPGKYFIISVTGSPDEVTECYKLIASAKSSISAPLAMEINLSCPNITGAPPPAYSGAALIQYLLKLSRLITSRPDLPRLPFGLKTPPYTHVTEYRNLINALLLSAASNQGTSPLSFITATNTLGSCLVLDSGDTRSDDQASQPMSFPSLPGTGIGGMAGPPLHPLALGNVATIRRMLDEHPDVLDHVRIIGVGGVLDAAGYRRMRAVGAAAVGVGTGLGLRGVGIFDEIGKCLGDKC